VLVTLAACTSPHEDRSIGNLNSKSVDAIMLNFSDPTESVKYFSGELAQAPSDVEAKRNLAGALARAHRFDEAVGFYKEVTAAGPMPPTDRLTFADALVRTGDWKAAATQLAKLPDSERSYDRYRLAAVLADARGDWAAADRHYAQARSLTVQPAVILNNWGVSKLSRGSYSDAEEKFREAVSFDRTLFAAKDNLVIARGRQRNYRLPIIPVTETEKAELLHDLAVVAIDNGDMVVARDLLAEALEVHPQHFEAAAVKLAGLEEGARPPTTNHAPGPL
jgi:tetratricopeptide (TPR) repeat protein